MRIPGWILITGSLIAVLLLGARVYVTCLIEQQRVLLAQSRQFIAEGPSYEHMWKQLAAGIYESGRNDPALQTLLKAQQISVDVKTPSTSPVSSALPANAPSP